MSAGAQVSPTRGEGLLLSRRRKGETQFEAAEGWDVHVDTYREWEADRGAEIPRAALGALKPHEICLLLRRRAKITQKQLASKIGVTRLWIVQMENGEGNVDRLREFWGI